MEPIKNTYNETFINKVAESILNYDSKFQKKEFHMLVFNNDWDNYELKERMNHVTKCLHDCLPKDFESAISIIMKVAPDYSFSYGFAPMIFPNYVEMYGLENWDVSINALELFTKYSSSEFAVRPFIIKDKERMMSKMLQWAQDDNHHVRRLASEGCRTRLPWAISLPEFKKDPTMIIPILQLLKNDSEEYVRRSVANNLNDISKDHPELVLTIAKDWYGQSKTTDWIVKHGLRTLLKSGHTEALQIFGFDNPKHIDVKNLNITNQKVQIGNQLSFSFIIHKNNEEHAKLRLEYAIYFMRANGKLTKKVFKISEREFTQADERINRNHSFKLITTRKYYPGIHKLSIIVNGVEKSVEQFELMNASEK
ncbi:DNA alkylation repair protein [Bacillus solimangrovi]|uniref:DNA alkylation repair protein n=1 Tax=Bacillus solimangrovi TaxID=1305675 RepID=A0A1E5LF22_9BACI|nr:DNA alkylation repair protein [Bacillus solimangrovi]OEH92673.1 hypothetical protein BFG57_01315 [Bacillus solimangrovi]